MDAVPESSDAGQAVYAPGATHAPHQAPKEYIERYKGKFDHGWDKQREITLANQKKLGVVPADTKLAAKPEAIRDWDKLTADEKMLFARQMEVFAGFGEHTDHEVGRLVAAIEAMGEMDNTPFTWTKQVASNFGGTRNGMIVHWPRGIRAKNEVRSQFHHVIDIAPTVLEVCGLPEPTQVNGIQQRPLEGVSIAHSFDDAQSRERHTTQYFEIFCNRAIYHDGWVAATVHKAPWESGPRVESFDQDRWELDNQFTGRIHKVTVEVK